MSRYEHATGEYLLPAAAVSQVKKAVRDAHNQVRAQVLAEAARFWEHGAKKTRSPKLYRDRLQDWCYPPGSPLPGQLYTTAPPSKVRGLNDQLLEGFHEMLEELADKPRKLQAKDLDTHHRMRLKTKTNRDTRSPLAGTEAVIVFAGRTVHWRVADNNHAVEDAEAHPVAVAFFRALDQVKWTRGTGGKTYYRCEYTPMQDPASVRHEYGPHLNRPRSTRFDRPLTAPARW